MAGSGRRVRIVGVLQGYDLGDELDPQLELGVLQQLPHAYFPDTPHSTFDPLSDPLNDPFPEELR